MLKRTPGTRSTVLTCGQRGARDLRAATTMWGLLVWAYKRELVRYCEGRVSDFSHGGGGGSNAETVCRALRSGMVRSGPVARVTRVPVHPDAEWVHGLVRSLDRDEFWLIVRSAEAEQPPEWNPMIEPLRVVPLLKANGRPRMIVCPIEKRPVACRIEVHGVPPAEAEATRQAARERYAHWHRLLWAMREKILEQDALTRWRVTGVGAEAEPWCGR